MTTTIEDVIAAAKTQFLELWPEAQTEAAFDYGLASGGESNAWLAIKNTIYQLANNIPDRLRTAEGDEAAYTALWDQLKPALDAYAASCRERKYTGWSNSSTGPIRYADENVDTTFLIFKGSPEEVVDFLHRETGQ